MDPFSRYVPKKKGKIFTVENIFRPEVDLTVEDFCMWVDTPRSKHNIIYNIRDIVDCTVAESGALSYFQGLLGERLLSVVLDELVNNLADKFNKKGTVSEGEVLREKPDYKGKNYAVTWSDHFILKYRGPTNFYILRKRPLEDKDSWYKAEKLGIIAREIDGIAYLHVGDTKYLLVGESKTNQSWGGVKDNYFQIVTEELFPPFKELFPRHKLTFVFIGRQDILFERNKLKTNPAKIAEALMARDVTPVFIPFPKTERRLEDYANEMTRLYPVAKAMARVLPTK